MHIGHLLMQACLLTICRFCMSLCSTRIASPASVLAARAGATQFQEYEDDRIIMESKKKFQKRLVTASAECDIKNYQGVVGRPGFDFPVLTKIPNTKFNCQHYGNGYFADLDTKCQVFHICDEGKKISFLCPNGTIFRQLDLICDWWFKVDCLAAPNHYAESSEMLTQAQRARLQSKHPILQPIKSAEQFSIKTKRKHALLNAPLGPDLEALAFNRRMDTSMEESDESIDFEDISLKRNNDRVKNLVSRVSKDSSDEIQAADETTSILGGKKPIGYIYPTPEKQINSYLGFEHYNNGKLFEQSNRVIESSMRSAKALETNVGKEFGSKMPVAMKPITTTLTTSTTTKQQSLGTTTVPFLNRGSTTHQTSTLNKKRIDNKLTNVSTQLNANYSLYTTAKKPTTKGKGKPFYTPTIPSLTNKATPRIREMDPSSATISGATKNAMEMMKTLHELDITKAILVNRSSIGVSPSFGPNALHSLALYFADDLDVNATSTMNPTRIQPRAERLSMNEEHPLYSNTYTTLLSQRTVDRYKQLFEVHTPVVTSDNLQITNRLSNDSDNDLEGQYSRHPVYSVAGSPQIRELAQVFTHALSAYLQDPDTFRRILSDIRPKPAQRLIVSNHIDRLENPKNEEISSEETSYFLTFNQITPAPWEALMKNSESLDISESTLPTTVNFETTSSNADTTTEISCKTTSGSHKEIPKHYDDNLLTKDISHTAEKQHKKLHAHDGTSKNELADEVNDELGTLRPPAYRTIENPENYDETARNSSYFWQHKDTASKITGTKSTSPRWSGELLKTTTEPANTVYFKLLPPRHGNSNLFHQKAFIASEQDEILEDGEQLQRAQSQSIIASHNSLESTHKRKTMYSPFNMNALQQSLIKNAVSTSMTPITVKGHYITKQLENDNTESSTMPVDIVSQPIYKKSTATPKTETTVNYTLSLDPLTINDGLMELERDAGQGKIVAHAYLPNNEMKITHDFAASTAPLLSPLFSTRPSNITATRRGKNVSVEKLSEDKPNENKVMETLQIKANQMFGDLDDTEADHLMNVIKTADTNKSVRKLILLLIQTCDEDHTKTVEESRKALLEALISMDRQDNSSEIHVVKSKPNRRGKNLGRPTTTVKTPVFLYNSTQYERFTGTTTGLDLENRGELIITEPTTSSYDRITTDLDLLTETSTTLFPESSLNTDMDTTTTAINLLSGQYVTTNIPTTTTIDYDTTANDFPTTDHHTTTITTAIPITSRDLLEPILKNKNITSRNRALAVTDNGEFVATSVRNNFNQHSDSRALELLRSLYSLASQWG